MNFRNIVMAELASEIRLRGKAMRYRGRLDVELDADDEVEEIHLRIEPVYSPIAELTVRALANIGEPAYSYFVRSSARKTRGKILFRVRDRLLAATPHDLLDAFEWSIGRILSSDHQSGLPPDILAEATERWHELGEPGGSEEAGQDC